MRSVVAWTETPPEKEGVKNVCYDLCFKPDGSQLVAAVGARVLVYDAADGELLHSLKGHKAAVYAVAFAANGKRFASGGADKTVIIWTSKAEGILKYSHGDSIQALAYNPVTQQLASGTAGDLGLWSQEQKAVTKHKVSSKILCLAWTPDGALLAAGCFDGTVSIRDRGGNETARVAAAATPAWSVAWSPEDAPTLAVGCLDGLLRFFNAAGVQKHRDRQVQGDPLALAYLGEEHLMAAGTDGTIQMLSREGVSLVTLQGRTSWLWRVAARPHASAIAYGAEDGSITVAQLVFSTVHGLYGDRYAYREAMTDVIIQHLVTEQKVRIKCRDLVKKVAVYRGRVAVQLPTRVVVYELVPPAEGAPDESDMRYRAAAKIPAAWECNLLVVASAHLVLCQDKKLQLHDFTGALVREWSLDTVIRYIKVAGGPPGREMLLVGLKSGQVVKIFVDNPFPIPLVSHGSGVRCLDVSLDRARLALVDEGGRVVVYDLATQAVSFSAEGANSVAWNSECADMLCYSGGGALSIRTGDFPPHSQRMQGHVVGFKGSKVFCLQSAAMTTIDVPQSASMFRYMERKDWAGAYRMACLGVTDADWRALAHAALQDVEFEVARSAFVRLRDPRAAELADRVAGGLRGGVPRRLLAAEALAWQGRYTEAARLYTEEGRLDRAVEMFSALRQFDEAKKWADDYARTSRGTGGGAGGAAPPAAAAELLGRQAEWSEEVANYAAAAEMYAKAGRADRAAALMARHGWWDRLLALVRTLEAPRHAAVLASAAAALRRAGQHGAAKEALLRLGDGAGLADLAVETQRWEDAALLAAAHPELAPRVHLPRAAWLAARDRFGEAGEAYRAGGRPDLARALLRGLADAAARRERFGEAAAAHHRLAEDAAQDAAVDPAAAAAFESAYRAAELYAAYAVVHERAVRPFRTADDGTLFGAARFLCARLLPRAAPPPPPGVRLSTALLALARGALTLGAFKTARLAYARLQALALPPEARADAELQSVMVRARPFADAEELLPVCFRCGATNAVVPQQEDVCACCGAAFHYSPLTWQPLPLVEFEVEPGIGDEEALALIGEGASDTGGLASMARQGSQGNDHGGGGGDGSGANVLTLDEPAGGGGGEGGGGLGEAWAAQALAPRAPIVLDRAALRRLRAGEVLLRRWPGGVRRRQWFRVVDPDAAVVLGPCGHFFEADEFEMAVLEHGVAPFSRQQLPADGQSSSEDASAAAGA